MTVTKVETTEQLKGIVAAVNGGTGLNIIPSNGVVLGNGTSPVTTVSPGSNGQVLQSNGSTWLAASIPVVTSFNIDGGSATSTYTGDLRVDFGAAT